MVASVGNNGEEEESGVQYPAGYPQVIGVGSVNQHMERSTFSARGAGVELMAPGENVPTSYFLQECGVCNGTSFATPHVTAVAAMLWSFDSSKSSQYIRQLLQKSARGLGEPEEYGYGLVDYGYACDIMDGFQMEETGGINTSEVLGFDVPEIVEGLWNKTEHTTLLGKNPNEILLKYNIIADDEFKGSTDANAVLHGRGDTNYVGAVRYLYMIARDMKNDSLATTKSKLQNAMTAYDKYTTGLDSDSNGKIKDAVVYATTHDSCNTKEGMSLQVLGLACHIVGDTYAHSVIIPNYSSLENRAKDKGHAMSYYFTKTAGMKDEIGSSILYTRELKQYAKGSTDKEIDDKKEEIRKDFIDNTEYLEKRYIIAAKDGVSRLLTLYNENCICDPYMFCPGYSSASSNHYRLQNLAYYVNKAYKTTVNIENSLYNINGDKVKYVSNTVWSELSKFK